MNLVLRDSTAFLIVVLFSFASITSGCKSTSPAPSETAQTAPQDTSPSPPAQQMSVDDLVAPIALYPDQLLAQVLTTAVNPQEILDLGNWLLQNQSLQGDAMTNAAKKAGSVRRNCWRSSRRSSTTCASKWTGLVNSDKPSARTRKESWTPCSASASRPSKWATSRRVRR